ncbi:XRE family transcriptional regulator [Streptomyces diacarni]|uniref:XRE family transcriptional regulator n=1 Tax=Streptomyces diacarni TaxID=2800381 RepID=A0A367ESA6_9ACTN|nr:helix-turn-helix transcriptional regulator [Streptomyces diacarni]RCG20931.1 XRE family transcriptional regulator [Streptomyces diacarni]
MAWRYAGDQMKRWREAAGISRQALAQEAGYGYDAIKGMERGVRKVQAHVLRIADEMCGAQGKLAAAVEFLRPEPFPSYSQDFMQAESEAVAHSSYENEFVPGLLQTEEVVRALFNNYCPPLDDETIEERVEARLKRQVMLDKQTKAFSFVISENALRDCVVGGESRTRQLRHLLDVGARRNVTIQVLSSGGGPHAGRRGPFVLLETPDHEHLGYEEGQTTGVLHSDLGKIGTLRQRHEMILRQALSPEGSARFIAELTEEL